MLFHVSESGGIRICYMHYQACRTVNSQLNFTFHHLPFVMSRASRVAKEAALQRLFPPATTSDSEADDLNSGELCGIEDDDVAHSCDGILSTHGNDQASVSDDE